MKNIQKLESKKKADTPEAQSHVILEVEKPQKSDIRMERNGQHKYYTRSSTKRVNRVTTWLLDLRSFKTYAAEKQQHIKAHNTFLA